MDGAGKVFEDMPDSVDEVEVEQMGIMNFGDRMDMMAFQHHGKERGFEDAVENAGVGYRVERNNF